MFTTFFSGHYQPLSWLTLAINYHFWGLQPSGYHLTNLMLHVANAVVFYFIARRLLAAARPEAGGADLTVAGVLAALLFAVHPLRVESVAWVTERRNVLASLFYLLSINSYLRGRKGVFWSFIFFVLSLFSMAIGITLPLILIILDYYPLGRRAWLEKIPFFVAAAVFGAVGVYAQSVAGGVIALGNYGFGARAAHAVYDVTFYLGKTLAPVGLSPLYEIPFPFQPWVPRFVACGLGVAVLTAVFVALRRRFPSLLAAWAAYVAALIPVLGLVHLWIQLAADRYTYLACLSWAVLAGGIFLTIAERGPGARRAALAFFVVLVAALGSLSWRQCEIWRDSQSLWERVYAVEPDNSFANDHLGLMRASAGDLVGAIAHFRAAIAINPFFDVAHNNLAAALMAQGHPDQAEEEYKKTLAIDSHNPKALNNLALLLLNRGRLEESISIYRRALQDDPSLVPARVNIGTAFMRLGRPAESMPFLADALRLAPRSPEVNINLGLALAMQGRYKEAVPLFQEALRLDPGSAQARAFLQRAQSAR
jgi:tetratricopeptide (TPR) repeat protein